jgi:hypothetical protein
MAARAYHKPNNIILLDMHRGVDTSQVRFPPGGCDAVPPGNPGLMIALRFYARKALKAQWQAQGIRVSYVLPRLTNQAAEQYLTEHWRELLPQALRLVERVEQSNITSAARRRKR